MTRNAKVGCAAAAVFSLGCCVAGCLVTEQWVDFRPAAGELDRQMKQAQKNGIPLTEEEVEALVVLGPGENAAPLIEKIVAFRSGRELPESDEVRQALDNGDLATVRKAIDSWAPALADLEAIAGKRGTLLNKDRELGLAVPFPEFESLREARSFLAVRARFRGKTGDADGAMRDLRTLRRVGQVVGTEPTLVAGIFGISFRLVSLRTARTLAVEWADQPRRLDLLRRFASEPVPPPDLQNSFAGEAHMVVATLRNLPSFGGYSGLSDLLEGNDTGRDRPIDPKKLVRTGEPRGVIERGILAKVLGFWNGAWPAVERSATDAAGLERAIRAGSTRLAAERGFASHIAALLAASYHVASSAPLVLQTETALTLETLDLFEYRARFGRFPDALAEAGPVRDDPMDGKPLRYWTDGKAFRLWSVGPNRKDEDGKTAREIGGEEASSHEVGDQVSRFPLPKVSER